MKDRKQPDQEEKTGTTENPQHIMDIRPTAMRRAKGQAGLTRDIQAKLGQQLRSYYDGLIEPAPDRFVELLQQLDEKPGSKDQE
jgi:Anti-sigma factor NepR